MIEPVDEGAFQIFSGVGWQRGSLAMDQCDLSSFGASTLYSGGGIQIHGDVASLFPGTIRIETFFDGGAPTWITTNSTLFSFKACPTFCNLFTIYGLVDTPGGYSSFSRVTNFQPLGDFRGSIQTRTIVKNDGVAVFDFVYPLTGISHNSSFKTANIWNTVFHSPFI